MTTSRSDPVWLRFPRDLFDDCIERAMSRLQRGAAAMRLAGGLTETQGRTIIHVRAPEIALPEPVTPTVFVLVCSDEAARRDWLRVWKGRRFEGPAAVLFAGAAGSGASGMLSGRFKPARRARDVPLDTLDLSGGGMQKIPLAGPSPEMPGPEVPGPLSMEARWSRTADALGPEVLARIAASRIAIVGCSRLGSRVAEDLVFGFGARHLTLIDGDRVEPHNLGEASLLFGEEAVGKRKAVALAGGIRDAAPWALPRALPVMLAPGATAALQALRGADLVISATDTVGSRLWAAWTCAAAQVPLLDLGVGALEETAGRGDRGRERETRDDVGREERGRAGSLIVGADVRLIAGGDAPRCLLCMGGLGGAETVSAALERATQEQTLEEETRGRQARERRTRGRQARPDGREVARSEERLGRFRRRGSLRHLAQHASSIAMQLVTELFTNETFAPAHVRLRGFNLTRTDADPFDERNPEDCLCRHHGAGRQAANLLSTGPICRN